MSLIFPAPSGPHGVGLHTYHWIDQTRLEQNVTQKQRRELMASVYYPTKHKQTIPRLLYDADALQSSKEFVQTKSGIPAWLLGGWDRLSVHAQHDAPLLSCSTSFPVVIVTHGAPTMVQHYTWLLEELASQGYVVIGINHPYVASVTRFPDGRVVKTLVLEKRANSPREVYKAWKNEQLTTCVQDIGFVLEKLRALPAADAHDVWGKLDVQRIGITGHSFGGNVALLAGAAYKNIAAVVTMDGFDEALGLLQNKQFLTPCLLLLGGNGVRWQGEGVAYRQQLDRFVAQHKEVITEVVLPDVGHGVFSDLPLLLQSTLRTRLLARFFDFDLDATLVQSYQALEETRQKLVVFFHQHLKK